MRRASYALIPGLILCLILPAALAGQGSALFNEQFGKWNVDFLWPDSQGYSRSTSEGSSEEDGIKIATSTLLMTSSDDAGRMVRIDVAKYSKKSSELSNSTNLEQIARDALRESGSCEIVNVTRREVDGKPGIFAIGEGCSQGRTAYAAVYPIDHSLDRTAREMMSSAVCTVVSTFDMETTESLINSIHVERGY